MEAFILKLIEEAKEVNGVHVVDIGRAYSDDERDRALKELAYALSANTKQRGINLNCSLMHFYQLGATAVFGDKGLALSFTRKGDAYDHVIGEYVAMSRYSEGQVIPLPVKNSKTRPTVVSSIVNAIRTKYIPFTPFLPVKLFETQVETDHEITE